MPVSHLVLVTCSLENESPFAALDARAFRLHHAALAEAEDLAACRAEVDDVLALDPSEPLGPHVDFGQLMRAVRADGGQILSLCHGKRRIGHGDHLPKCFLLHPTPAVGGVFEKGATEEEWRHRRTGNRGRALGQAFGGDRVKEDR